MKLGHWVAPRFARKMIVSAKNDNYGLWISIWVRSDNIKRGRGNGKLNQWDSMFQWDQKGWNTKEFSYVLQVQKSQV